MVDLELQVEEVRTGDIQVRGLYISCCPAPAEAFRWLIWLVIACPPKLPEVNNPTFHHRFCKVLSVASTLQERINSDMKR